MRAPEISAAALALALAACGRVEDHRAADARGVRLEGSERPVPTSHAATAVTFHPAGRAPVPLEVEVAITAPAIRQGLMYREHLPPDAGMIFVFHSSKVQTFWMKNTLIPLDMIFVDEGGTVVGVVEQTTPRSLEGRGVERESRFVIEVNAGWAAEHGVAAGTTVSLEGVPVDQATVD
jgi:uncharacterized membrane protein (UPF0127 family)